MSASDESPRVRQLFLRALGLVYLIAFASFGLQITGLIGANGILPAADYLTWVAAQRGTLGFWLVPTVFWLNSSDAALQFVCVAGVIGSLFLLARFDGRPLLLLLFILYLSLVSVGQDFMAYQWDNLLLEAGWLALLAGSWPGAAAWLYRWLLFRLIFMSGASKLLSGDPSWRKLTALDYHFATQPLPTVIGWYVHHLPGWFHQVAAALMFAIELGAPILILATRRLRLLSAGALAALQVLIMLTGNYAFFNLLSVALCLWLLDDSALSRWSPAHLSARITQVEAPGDKRTSGRLPSSIVACAVFLLGSLQLCASVGVGLPAPLSGILYWIEPLHIVNRYGLFAVMTTERSEIIVEGSNDGQTWLEYVFKYQPGDVHTAPQWVEPYQPRLDWQLWFAALGYTSEKPWLTDRLFGSGSRVPFWLSSYSADPWFLSFIVRLLRGSPEVLALMDTNPFPHAPPRYIRARLYRYEITDLASQNSEGVWWQRELSGSYLPAISLSDGP